MAYFPASAPILNGVWFVSTTETGGTFSRSHSGPVAPARHFWIDEDGLWVLIALPDCDRQEFEHFLSRELPDYSFKAHHTDYVTESQALEQISERKRHELTKALAA